MHKNCTVNMHRNCKVNSKQFKESKLAHHLLDDLKGIEIGGSFHNPFCLNTINVDYTNEMTVFKEIEKNITGNAVNIDVVAPGDKLPFPNESQDFVISSHVIEHFYDPIKAIQEWLRVVRKGGYVYMIIPHRDRTFDKDRDRTRLSELIDRHEKSNQTNSNDAHSHQTFWTTEDFLELCKHFNWKVFAVQDVDDKVENGFTIVIQKN
uniref:Methyltransferase type 11 domain-containing protein n=1 Tax=Acrobeloides nanus TaxID=290746 RepID=A0A914CUY1_9BILA